MDSEGNGGYAIWWWMTKSVPLTSLIHGYAILRTDLDTLEPLQGIHWKSSRLHLGGRVFSLRVCSGCYSPMPFEERDSISTITKTFSLGFSSFVELQG